MQRVTLVLLVLCAFVGADMAVHYAAATERDNRRIIFFPKQGAKKRNSRSIFPLFRLFESDRSRSRVNVPSRDRNASDGSWQRRQAEANADKKEPKNPDAKVILVIGDAFAAGLAKGLDVAFADNPAVRVEAEARGSSGLVRVDAYDWRQASRDLIAKQERVDAVVIMLGMNDRQRMRDGGKRRELRSPEWEADYRRRVQDLLTIFVAAGKPVVWVGLPPTANSEFAADFTYFNDIYRERVAAEGSLFVDIWKNFLDDEGHFTRQGPDIEGRVVSLRRGDGLGFTGAGYRKLAFFVEKALRQVLVIDGGPALTLDIDPDGRPVGPRIGAVLPLTGPIASADDPLAGAVPLTSGDETNALYKLTVMGDAPASVPGRVDDFRWPRPR